MTFDPITATAETFDPFVGDTFTVESEAGPIALTLDNVKVFAGSVIRDSHVEVDGVVHPPRKAFALTFEGPREPVLQSATINIDHAKLGRMVLFLSPFRQDHDCMLYETVFN